MYAPEWHHQRHETSTPFDGFFCFCLLSGRRGQLTDGWRGRGGLDRIRGYDGLVGNIWLASRMFVGWDKVHVVMYAPLENANFESFCCYLFRFSFHSYLFVPSSSSNEPFTWTRFRRQTFLSKHNIYVRKTRHDRYGYKILQTRQKHIDNYLTELCVHGAEPVLFFSLPFP